MIDTSKTVGGNETSAERKLLRQREVNEALVLSSLHAHEGRRG